jgi:flagellar biosynthesis protein FliP
MYMSTTQISRLPKRIGMVVPLLGSFLALLLVAPQMGYAADSAILPDVALSIGGKGIGVDGSGLNSSLKIVILLTILSFAPAMMLTMTCFTRIAVVLGMVRTAIGTQSLPPNMVITGLAMFLTFSVMNPVFSQMYTEGIAPYMEGKMGDDEAFKKATTPLKNFLIRNTRDKDLQLFIEITRSEQPKEESDLSLLVVVPAFVISELNLAFKIGFLIALPFLVLDMVVSSVLTTLSMITLPPVVISLPLKLMLFVLVDGWHLVISSLVKTYRVE